MFLTQVPDNCPLCHFLLVEKDINDMTTHRLCCEDKDHNVWAFYNDLYDNDSKNIRHLNVRYLDYQIFYNFDLNNMIIYFLDEENINFDNHFIDDKIYFVPSSKEDFINKIQMIKVFH